MAEKNDQHWRSEKDDTQIVWLTLDRKDTSANALNQAVLHELSTILQTITEDATVRGVVFQSAKKDFAVGADIKAVAEMNTDQRCDFVALGQNVFQQIADLGVPTVAVFEGSALGGGLELGLACQYRVASNEPSVKLGLPEVLLGIHPGWGGTVRLPKWVNPSTALMMQMTGKKLSTRAAKRCGLVDICVAPRYLEKAARAHIEKGMRRPCMNWRKKVMLSTPGRAVMAMMAEYQLKKTVKREHYPAPFAIIELWQQLGSSVNDKQSLQYELDSMRGLLQHNTAEELLRVFTLQEHLKAQAKATICTTKRVHVVGAGTMGGDIAIWCAKNGYRVTLQDTLRDNLAKVKARAARLFSQTLKQPMLCQKAMDNLIIDEQGYGIADADVIIEAIFEDLAVKKQCFSAIEEKAKPDALLASNTSSLSLQQIASALKQPERLVGIHFFNPVSRMQLVEVVQGDVSDKGAVEQAIVFVKTLNRLPLHVKDKPGFLVNRVLFPYLIEAMHLLDEGRQAEQIDAALLSFGMPMGPITLADTVGLDICAAVAKNLGEVPKQLAALVEANHLGKKTNKGFYTYKKGKKVSQIRSVRRAPMSGQDIEARLIHSMLNEAMACIDEKIVMSTDDLDAGMIFGTGFAPFRGGPMHYASQIGFSSVHRTLTELADRYGDRFAPHARWQQS